MDNGQLNGIANFIWSVADDILRDIYRRPQYRDIILPLTIIRRLDAVLEPTKAEVLERKEAADRGQVLNPDLVLKSASKQVFYNISPFTLNDLRARARQQQLRADFEAYLDGFSPNVQDILDNFKFRDQIPTLVKADILGDLIVKFLDPTINLSPRPVLDAQGRVVRPGLDNHAMGTIFEELIRRFNEASNEEAGEHFTPRDVVRLMAQLVFLPVADRIESSTYNVYDGACGTGGMLTVAEETLLDLARARGKVVSIHLYGQESQPETYAVCKADLLLKGQGEEAENIRLGSTLSRDEFPAERFEFMLSNPPYGKSWKMDLEKMGGKADLRDRRFVVAHAGDPDLRLITRSSDGQLLFLVNLLSKMKPHSSLGSRIAEIHNGSSLFTGDAGQGESNIRRWIIENDWLEAIIALPLNMFYNTGIATYVWVLTNRKPEARRGKVQLIDATAWSRPLRKNLGRKNCELTEADLDRICRAFLELEESERSKVFPNQAFGFWKVTVERPLRLRVDLAEADLERLRRACLEVGEAFVYPLARSVAQTLGPGLHLDFNRFIQAVEVEGRRQEIKLTDKRRRLLQTVLAHPDPAAAPVIKKVHKAGQTEADPGQGRFEATLAGRLRIVEYEPDPALRDTEQIPLLEPGGIPAFFDREVRPHAPDAWLDPEATRIGYEISFTRHFYKPQPLRSLAEIKAELVALERETEGLLDQILGEA